jgi:small subunit ribosomal protein S9
LEEAKEKYKRMRKVQTGRVMNQMGKARRKRAYAQVKVKPGTGVVTINGKNIQDYFGDTYYRVETLKPLAFTGTSGTLDIKFQVFGGGQKGQSECMGYALARALMKINPNYK